LPGNTGIREKLSEKPLRALTHIEITADAIALDVGCGGGRTLSRLAAMAPDGIVYGIEYAKGSVAQTRAHNCKLANAGKVVVENASVSQLPFEDGKFDVATAVETQYHWPSIEAECR
jgi:ubiquinone/menaquinone biosynthesis C-methylase UbiE